MSVHSYAIEYTCTLKSTQFISARTLRSLSAKLKRAGYEGPWLTVYDAIGDAIGRVSAAGWNT